jgi:hypothetical protein
MAIGKYKFKNSKIWAVQWNYRNRIEIENILNKNSNLFEKYVFDGRIYFVGSDIKDIKENSWLISDNKYFNNWDGKVLSDKEFKDLYEYDGYYAISI